MRLKSRKTMTAALAVMLVSAACSSTTNAATSQPTPSTASSSGVATPSAAASTGGSGPAASSTAEPSAAGGPAAPDPFLDKADAGKTINVLMVNNPQMLALQKHIGAFTAQTGIDVKFTVLPENDMRNKASLEFKNQAGQYDVTSLSNFEVPIYAKNGWLTPLTSYIAKDPGFNQPDIFPSLTAALSYKGDVYGEPFYGESSQMMYRKDIFASKGLTMPTNPTWDQIADFAAKLDGVQPGMKGICLRGQPGWGEGMASMTTVVNTFGGTWFDKDWTPQVNAQPFKDAINFYVNLVKAHGEVGAANAGYTENVTDFQQSKCAMWYDSTAAQPEGNGSPITGKVGYAQAPHKVTAHSGWLYAWSWMMEKRAAQPDAAWKFISWASSQQYENLVGTQDGWITVPAGKRISLYSNSNYTSQAAAVAANTLLALKNADPTNPGVQPRPTNAISWVDVPEYTALGDKVGALIAAAINGQGSVDDALNQGQTLATAVAANYK